MWKRIQELLDSTITRIVLAVIALVLPVNILTLIMSYTLVSGNREQIYREMQIRLDSSADDLSRQLAAATKRLTRLNFDDPDFRQMEFPTENLERPDVSSSLYEANDNLKKARQEHEVVDAVYFRFRERDYTILNGYTNSAGSGLREIISQAAAEEAVSGTEWRMRRMEEVDLLFSHARWNNADYGIFVNLNWCLKRMGLNPSRGRCFFFMDSETGQCSKEGEAYITGEDMTLAKMKKSPKYKVLTAGLEIPDIVLVEVVEVKQVAQSIPGTVVLLEVIAIGLSCLAIPLLLTYIHKWVNRPLLRLTSAMDQIEGGNLDFRIEQKERGREFEQINRNFNLMMKQVKDLKINAYEKELEKKDIRMRYLSQQVQPHFILNAMNILYSYEPEEYPLIQKMILCLSKYFRYIVRVNADFVELEKEMDHIRNYFDIQLARYPEQFFSIVEYEEALGKAMIPPLLVQNFAENSIKHSLRAGNKITIFVITDYLREEGKRDRMRIRLADTGEGISDELVAKIEQFKETGRPQEGLGVGIQNSIERLKYLYDSRETDIRFWRDDTFGGTTVEILLPIYYKGDPRHEDTVSG